MAIIVADLVARLRAEDAGVEQTLDRTRSNLQSVERQAQSTGRTTSQMASATAAAYSRSQAASTRLRIAEDQLAEAKRTGATNTQQLMALEARVQSARASAISATSRYQQVQHSAARVTNTMNTANRQAATSHTAAADASASHTRNLSNLQIVASKARLALQTVTAAAGATATLKFFTDAVQNARRLAAQTNQLNVIFGDSRIQIEAWGRAAADTMRMSQREAQGAAVQFATFGKAAGLTGENLAAFSMKTTKLAADLASFQGVTVEEAILAMGSAFAGETETMRKYGVLLDENTLKEAAYAHGLAATGTQLTQQQKVAAVYYSMMEQLDYAQGDVERSNGKFGASVKTLKARFEEFSATIGQKVMPIAQTFIDLLSGPGISGAGEGIGILASTVGVLASAFNSLPGPLKAALAAIVAVRVAQTLLQNRMAQGPGVISRFGTAYSTALGYVRQANPGISTAGAHMRTLASGVTGATGAMGMMRSAGRGLMATLGGPWGLAIAGATAILGFWIAKKQEDKAKSQEAKAATEEWSEALIESKGAINSSIRAMAAKKIAETDALETAEKLGISQRELIDVILQGRGAVDEWYAALVKSGRIKEGAFGGTIGDIQRLASEYDNGRMKAEQIAKATGDVRVSFDGTAQSTGAMTEAMTEFQESTDGAASKVDKLAKALNQLTADGQTEEEAQQAWADNIRELSEALTEAGTAAVNANGKIDFTTKAGSELQDAVQKQAEAFNQVASAAFTAAQAQGKSVPEAAEIARQKLIDQRKALIDMLTAQGMGIDTANRLADAYGLIPSDVVTRLNVQGFDDANAGIGTLLVQLNSLPREKPVSVTAPGGQAAVDLLNSLGIKVRADNKKNIEVTSPMAPAVLDLLNRLGLSVVTNNGKTIIVTDNGTAAVVQSNIDAIHGRQIRVSVIYVDKAGNEVRGIDPSTGGVPLKPEYFKELAPKGKATGGPIVGPGTGTSDDVPLWGSNGEFMMKAAAVRRYGLPFMHAVNAQRLATGGPVGAAPTGGGDQAAVADPGTATVAVPGMGLPAALGQVADTVTAVKDSQLDPAMTEATAGVTEYGLATREQTAAVQAAWTATGSAVTTAAGTVIGPAVRGVGQVAQSTVAGMVAPALAGMRSNVAVTAAGVQTAAAGQINPAIASVGSTVQGVHAGTVDPVLAAMRGAVGNTAASFGTGAAAIASQWNSVREATAAPVRFTIGTVFNNGLVGMWNSVADLIGTSKMNPYPLAFASGGVMPGYTPGRDVHHFASPTGGNLALSGGEAIMRPEWTRAVGGPRAVDRMNALARSGGLRRVKGTDQYLGGNMAYASGGTIQGGAEITSDIQRTMWDAVRTAFPNVVLTSGTRYADVGSGFDNHMGQRALDLGGPMPEIARWIYQLNRTQPVEELIHAPLQGWQNLKSGQPLNYGAGTDADHYDHVHWAMAAMRSFAGRLVSMAGGGGGAPAMQKSMATVIEETLTPLRAQVEKSMGGSVFGGQMGQVPRGVFAKMNEAMTARLRDLATKYMGPAIGGGGGGERWRPMIIQALKKQGYPVDQAEVDAWVRQIDTESGGDPDIAQQIVDVNGTGEAAGVGLGQMIPGTWEAYRDPSLSNNRRDPWAMINAMVRYGHRRYGDSLLSNIGQGHGYAQGGTIPGTGDRDTVPGMLTPGEEVIRKGPAEKNRPMLKKINEGGDVRVFVTNWPAGAASASTTSVTATSALPAGTDPSLTATVPPVDTGVPASEVTADENKVAEAKRKHQEATDRVALAERKLEEVRANPKAKASQREAAEHAVVKAKNDVTAATEKLRQAEQKLDETRTTSTTTPGAGTSTTTTTTGTTPPEPPTAFEFTLRNPFQPFWFKGEKEYQERIIQRARELEQAEQERYGAGAGTGDTTTLSSMLGTENAVAERKRVLDEAEGKLRIAQMKLGEVQASKNPKPSQIEKARQDITRAENDVTKAKEDLAVAEQKLAENQAKPIKQPAITKMWVGGTVPGTGMSDTVPALLTPGEEVTRRAMAIKHRRLLKAINADKVARYASGGTAGFGGYSADDRDYMKPTSITDWLALGVGGASSVASMVAPYAQMVLSGQVDLGNAMPQLNTGANDPSGGFATSVVSDFASQISQQLNELIRAVKEGQDVHVTVQNDQSPSAAGLVGMSMGV
ncbi:tape measure protein [Gordonia phage TimTam]|uniref:Tape measure protein n=4 Tax=Nymphadoravirus nymphadora TaxID=2560507 RepID=A0A142KAP3_9CAUD|nr:tail length tape measure protein [Gordonia phage Nymphadora]AMS03176.1 tape measure protein [Gordonia phage Nymphadora]AOE43895.1 tape measure protein [Gordonia phage BatStarr]QDP43298.1 tape measure protein [Gordonia phage Eviarto]QDP43380.1 tape measure protein [Gordonia phage TimTam]